ncbi:sugar porter family MFS transporter [Streptomyces sp. RPT161]|uniref:sugar porter family MFS transporter n=1 Tax=Streptomyces sp. RPT161 TaxID=3015993 RepID=UPI0022B90C8D|nr:sugar porter family MFS transporter [Streptomyces sp. RPT161]
MSVHTQGDQTGDSQNVLEMLDQRPPTSFYWSLTLLATIGGFLFGYDTANIGSALSFVPYHLTGFALGYLVAGASVGAAVGALLAGPLTDLFGRKSLLIADAGIYTVGALLSAVTWHAWVLIAARTLIGLAIGADSAIATAYIAEYAPADRRGALSMLQQWMITVGILVSYVVALVLLRSLPGHAYGIDWRLIFGLGAVPALIGLVLRTRMPESPRWLLEKGRYGGVKKAIGQLGVEVTVEQVERTAAQLRAYEQARKGEAQVSSWTPGVRRALVVVCVFFTFQQITGINVPLYYGPHLLAPLFQSGGHGTTVDAAIAGVEVTAIMTALNVGATYFGFRYIDRVGRRVMSMGGYGGMAVSALIAAFGLGFLGGTAQIIVVMIGFSLFIASFAVGVGGTGWLIQGETFPTAVRGRAAAIGATVDWLANFALIEVFPTWQSGIGLAWVLVCFAGLAVAAVAFVYTFLPETKGLSVDEIIHLYEAQARPTHATGQASR